MYAEQFDTTKWEPLVNKMANAFSYIAKIHQATCSNLDLVQEAWLAILKANKGFDPTRGVKFITYAYKYVYHELLKYVKRQTRLRGKVISDTELLNKMNKIGPAAEGASISGIGLVDCHDLIDFISSELTEDEAKLIKLRFFEDAKIKELAKATNSSSGATWVSLNKTVKKMQRIARRNGIQ